MTENVRAIVIILIIVLGIGLVLSIVMRLMRAALVIGILILVVPAAITITWGDGTAYVSAFASLFTPAIEEKINDGYQFYMNKNAENPILDLDQIEEYAGAFTDEIESVLTDNGLEFDLEPPVFQKLPEVEKNNEGEEQSALDEVLGDEDRHSPTGNALEEILGKDSDLLRDNAGTGSAVDEILGTTQTQTPNDKTVIESILTE